MEITLEAIISLVGIFVGGGSIGGFLFWRQTKRKAKAEAALAEAEAKLKEAEAKKAEFEADKERQDYYQQLAKDLNEDREDRKRQNDELRAERDHYKNQRNELRDEMEKLARQFLDYKNENEREKSEMRRDIARQGRKTDAMTPFMCGRSGCKDRLRVTVSDDGEVKPRKNATKKHEIEPNNEE